MPSELVPTKYTENPPSPELAGKTADLLYTNCFYCRRVFIFPNIGHILYSGYQARVIDMLRSSGVDVRVSRRNAACYSEAKQLIQECVELGPLGGLFNLAMVG